GVTQVSLRNARYGVRYTVAAANVTATSFTFVPNHTLAGVYDLQAQFTDAFQAVVQTTNTLPIALAPLLPGQAATVAGNRVTVTSNPKGREGQPVLLSPGSNPPPARPFTGNVASLDFDFPLLPASPALARLQVDGVTSQVQVDWQAQPPTFTGPMVTL